MTEAYDGIQVVGMDLHRHRSVIVGWPRTAVGWAWREGWAGS